MSAQEMLYCCGLYSFFVLQKQFVRIFVGFVYVKYTLVERLFIVERRLLCREVYEEITLLIKKESNESYLTPTLLIFV